MDSRYKIIISNKNLYKEVELSAEDKEIKVGTSIECDIRLRKDLFFGQIELRFIKGENGWSVLCSDNLYLTVGDVQKMMTKNLRHGDILFLKYQESDTDVFSIEFLIDFDNGKKKYERAINLFEVNSLLIGSTNDSNIIVSGPYVSGDAIFVQKRNNSLCLTIQHTTYGVYHNGKKIESEAEIKSGDFFSLSDYFFYYKDDVIWAEIRDDMQINSLTYQDIPAHPLYPMFKRNTRIKAAINSEKIEILDPPAKPQKPKNDIITRLLPSVIMVVAGLAMSFISPFMLISSGLGVVTGIIGFIQSKKDFKTNSAARIEKYNIYIANKRKEIEKCRAEELETLEKIYINQQSEQERFSQFSSDLFDRTKEDEDFLCVRLGNGDVLSKREINYRKQEKLEVEDDLQRIPESICNEYKNIHNAPIVCDLKTANAIGVIGTEDFRFNIMKNMAIDIAARQFFSDVKMFFVAKKEHSDKIRWLRMLPHVYNEEIGIRNIVCDDESKNIIFEYLYKELTGREQQKSFKTRLIVFFYDEYGFQSHPLSKFVNKAKDLGITFVFFGNSQAEISAGCKYLIKGNDTSAATLIDVFDGAKATQFIYQTIPEDRALDIVKLLAPIHTEEISLEGSLTRNISLFELLNIIAVDDIDLDGRWKKSQVFKSMSAPIGVSKSGVVSLDLHDKAHGPHGLVAGTTGSGKSEILQTYILMMSTLFHPYEVGFVIIDFKGGGMVNQFRELPHLLGAITNIDGKEINRSLKSIKAELQRRQRLFADADVNHIDKYIKKYKSGEVSTPLPHLIIIVDEFAELKAEQPEFMKELISAARIGRSLGVHLILATQKPSGQVNEQIWSNSRFKLCLKVQSQEDSNEVLKSPLAAEIKEPGRAYLQVGNNEIFELFQSAYSGASEKADTSNIKEFTIYNLNDSGRRIPVYSQKKQKGDGNNSTQLDAIVKYVSEYCHDNNIEKLPDICLPALSEAIPFPAVDVTKMRGNCITAEIGIYDDPDNQRQEPAYLDIDNKNTLIIGSPQYGKTNLLQSIIKSIVLTATPERASIYIIDFASMFLKNFEKLNHVGGVVTSSEDEKLKNLFKLIFNEIEKRKQKLLSVGVSSFSSYIEAGYTDLPHIYLIVDNLTALSEIYLENDDSFLQICRDGISYGISCIVANPQTKGIGYKYMSNFANKIALYCNDNYEYSNLFDSSKLRPSEVPGRCVMEIDKRILEVQTYIAFDGEKEIDRSNAIHEFVNEVNNHSGDSRAAYIPCIPNLLTKEILSHGFGVSTSNMSIPIGLTYNEVSPLIVDFSALGILGVCGKEKFGHGNFVRYIVNETISANKESQIIIFDDVTRKYGDLQAKSGFYSVNTENLLDVFTKWNSILESRYKALSENGSFDGAPLLMIIQNMEAIRYISANQEIHDLFDDYINKYKRLNASIIISNFPNASLPYDAPEVLRLIKQNKQMLLLDDLDNLKVFDVPYESIRENKKRVLLGDGYYLNDNTVKKLKLAFAD